MTLAAPARCRASWAAARTVALSVALVACAGVTPPPRVAPRPAPPDVHGEPLALLPSGAVAWGRMELATLRASPHFESLLRLAGAQGEDLATLHRELGFDLFREADVAAVAVYLPPGQGDGPGWPLVYARGRMRREGVLQAARARSTEGVAPTEETEQGVRYWVSGVRAYVFPAEDVALVMDRALVRRVLARLSGRSPASVLDDPQFAPLWEEAGGSTGAALLAADLAALRARSSPRRRGNRLTDEGASLDAVVARADAPGAVTLHASGRSRDNASAAALVRALDDTRHELGARWEVRLFGLARLANQGVQVTSRGNLVRLEANATATEAGRLIRALTVAGELTSESSTGEGEGQGQGGD